MKLNIKIFGLLFMMLLLSSSVMAQNAKGEVFWTEFISQGKFTIDGTLTNDYNEGKFHYSDGVQAVFSIDVDTPQEICLNAGLLDTIHGEYISCNPENTEPICLSSVNDTLYGYCNTVGYDFQHIGHYFLIINTSGQDDNDYILETIEIIHSEFSGIMWILLALTVAFGFFAWWMKQAPAAIIAILMFVGFVITAITRYWYVFGDFWGASTIGIIIIFMLLLLQKFMEEYLA